MQPDESLWTGEVQRDRGSTWNVSDYFYLFAIVVAITGRCHDMHKSCVGA